MITKVVHGWRIGGLVRYLLGPGRANEHVEPRVIATWDGRDHVWEGGTVHALPDGAVDALVRALRAPVIAAELPEQGDPDKKGFVWHCSARVASGDRVLSDAEWAEIARELLDGAGVVRRGDVGGPRWVAVRHADEHIHIAVVLIRQDTCRRVWPKRDYPRLRETARRIERRLGLTLTAGPDGTAAAAPVRGEIEKAVRAGRGPARVELARSVRAIAGSVSGPAAFVAALEAAGVVVSVRWAPSGDLLGYKVALSGDVDRVGEPVWFLGSKLAPDLSLPRLMRGWAQAGAGSEVADPVEGARRRLDQARLAVGEARRGLLGEDPDDLAHAALDVLVAVRGWGPEFERAVDRFGRAARAPRGVRPQAGVTGAGLRRVARQLVRLRRVGTPYDPDAAGVALAVALAALIAEVAALQREWQRPHQAAAAQEARDLLRGWVRRHGGEVPDASVPVPVPVAGRGRGRTTARPRRDRRVGRGSG